MPSSNVLHASRTITSCAGEDETQPILRALKYCHAVQEEDVKKFVNNLVNLNWNEKITGIGLDASGLPYKRLMCEKSTSSTTTSCSGAIRGH